MSGRQLVTCPVCKVDCLIYDNKICNHSSDGGFRCVGSRGPLARKNSDQVELELLVQNVEDEQLANLTRVDKEYKYYRLMIQRLKSYLERE